MAHSHGSVDSRVGSLAASSTMTRTDSLQSLSGRTRKLDLVDPQPGQTRSGQGGPKRPRVEPSASSSNVLDLTIDSGTDDDDDIVIIEPAHVRAAQARKLEREQELANLGPWWREVDMKLRREQFILANAGLYKSLLPRDTGYFAKLVQLRKSLPATPSVPYQRLKQPSLIAKDAVMKDYQLTGLSFLAYCAENGINAILADEMGLGKTLQTLSLIAYLTETHGAKGPHLLVCPLSVLSSWMNEIARWLPGFKAMRFHGTLPARALLRDEFNASPPDLVVTTYEAFTAEQVFFKNKKSWGLCVLDEGHRIKNSDSQASAAVQGIRARMRIILSGTPLQNNLVELWALLHFLDPLVFHDKTMQPFKESFDLSAGNYDQAFLRNSQKFLELVMLRRTKEAVSSQLTVPPREEMTIYVPLSPTQKFWTKALLARSEAALLAEIFADFESKGKGKHRDAANDDGEEQVRANIQQAIDASKESSAANRGTTWTKLMNLLMQLRKVCDHPYLLPGAESEPFEVAEHIVGASSKLIVLDKLLESIPETEKVLVFSQFTGMLDLVQDFMHLRGYKYCRLDGSTSRPRRTLDIRLFQQANSPYQIYLISTRAGGLGINLTAASTVVMIDQDWNPQVDLQAIARAHRIGQDRNVKVYKLVCQDSVEEQMLTRLRKKLYLSAKVMGSMKNLNEQGRAAEDGVAADPDAAAQNGEEAPKMTRGELAGILRGGAGALAKWTTLDGQDPFESFKASTFGEIEQRGKVRDEKKEVGIQHDLGQKVSEEQRRQLEKEEEEAEALLLAGREAVQSRKFEGKIYQASYADIRKEWQEIQGKEARLDKSRTVLVDGFAVSRDTVANAKWEAVKTITSDPKALAQLQDVKRKRKTFEHEDWCVFCRDGGEVFVCRMCPRVAHGDCTGETKVALKAMSAYICPQHNCGTCGKNTSESGGLLFRCRTCPLAFCEDCLPPGDLESVGDVLPEFLVLGYGRQSTAHFIKCSDCIEHYSANPTETEQWRKEQDKIEARAREEGYDF